MRAHQAKAAEGQHPRRGGAQLMGAEPLRSVVTIRRATSMQPRCKQLTPDGVGTNTLEAGPREQIAWSTLRRPMNEADSIAGRQVGT